MLPGMRPGQYRIENEGKPFSAVRVWCAEQPADEAVLSIMAFTHALASDIQDMVSAEEPDTIIPTMIGQWLEARTGEQSLFIECLKPKYAFTRRERISMSVGVFGGRLCLVSSPRFMFIEQAPGLFGLAVGSYGSYLFERLAEEQTVRVH